MIVPEDRHNRRLRILSIAQKQEVSKNAQNIDRIFEKPLSTGFSCVLETELLLLRASPNLAIYKRRNTFLRLLSTFKLAR